jgi:Zn-dependent protease with chaperone function
MKSANCLLLRLCVIWGLLLTLAGVVAKCTWAQSPSGSNGHTDYDPTDTDETTAVNLTVDVDDDGFAEIMFDFESNLKQKYNFPSLLSRALGCSLEDINLSRDEQRQTTSLDARCNLPLNHKSFRHIGRMDLQPVRNFLNAEPNAAFFLFVSVPKHGVVRCDPEPKQLLANAVNNNCMYVLTAPSQTASPLYFEFGYSGTRVIRLSVVLGLVLLLPVALTFWFRRRSLTAPDEVKTAIWFAHRRFLTWTALWGTLVWWTALDLLRANELLRFLLPPWEWSDAAGSAIFPWVLLWIPPTVIYFLCLALSSPMQSLRGTQRTQRQILNQSFWAVARFVFPLSFVCLGIAEMLNAPRIAVLLIVAGIVTGKYATGRFIRAYVIELHALTSGELRDRAFAMAQRARTRLNQLYVLPTEQIRMANAFAHAAHNIFLTDYLLKNMSKAEVDAVVGHEIAHLQNKHLGRRMTITFLVVLVFAFSAGFLEYWLPRSFPSGPIFYGLFLLAFLFISRRNEFAADAGSVKLTGNAEAMITALARLTRLNTMPIQWGKLNEKLLTHPSAMRRIRRLAKDADIPEARVSQLLSQSGSSAVETYFVPPTALPAGKLFSTRCKAQITGKIAWTLLLTTALLPGAFALLAHRIGLEGGVHWLVYVIGFLSTLAADLALLNFLPMLGLQKLERQLREKCRAEQSVSKICNGLFVGLAPDSCPRVYEGNWVWDLGFLSLTQEYLSYWGEEARFVLRRDEITSSSLGPGPIGWFRSPSVYVTWRNTSGQESTFNLRPMQGRSMRSMAKETRRLAEDLENWRLALPASPNPLVGPKEVTNEVPIAPAFGEVTGVAPQILVKGPLLARDFLLNTFLAIGVILVFGLGLPPLDSLAPSRNSIDPGPTFGGLYVLVVVWLARAFVLTPYFRTREKKHSAQKAPATTT